MRVEQLTFTRFVAAIFIVIFHFGEELFPFNKAPLSVLVSHANLYVSYFFVLSGFVMIIAYSNKEHINTLEYYKKRFARIYPVYLLAIIALVGFMLVTKEYYFDGILLNLFLIQAWVQTQNGGFTTEQNSALVNEVLSNTGGGDDGTFILHGIFDDKGSPSTEQLQKAYETLDEKIQSNLPQKEQVQQTGQTQQTGQSQQSGQSQAGQTQQSNQ